MYRYHPMFWETNSGTEICEDHTYPGSFWQINPMFPEQVQKEWHGEVWAPEMQYK